MPRIPINAGNHVIQVSVPGSDPSQPTTVDGSAHPKYWPTFPGEDGFVGYVYIVDSSNKIRYDYEIELDRTVTFINGITVTPPDTEPYEIVIVLLGGRIHQN